MDINELIRIAEDGPPPPSQNAKYPFDRIKIGQSFVIEASRQTRADVAARCRSAAYRYGGRRGWKFLVRVDGENVRVWRTA